MSITICIEFEGTSVGSDNGIFSACTVFCIVIMNGTIFVKFELTSKLSTIFVEVDMDAVKCLKSCQFVTLSINVVVIVLTIQVIAGKWIVAHINKV